MLQTDNFYPSCAFYEEYAWVRSGREGEERQILPLPPYLSRESTEGCGDGAKSRNFLESRPLRLALDPNTGVPAPCFSLLGIISR